MKSQISPFGELLPAIAGRFRENREAVRAFAFVAFRRAVGQQTLAKAEPVDLDRNVLIVAVSDNAWKRNLESLAPAILAKISSIVGFSVIRRIDFRVVSGRFASAGPPNSTNAKQNLLRNEPNCPANIEQKAKQIADDGLRRAFTAAAAACLSNRPQASSKK